MRKMKELEKLMKSGEIDRREFLHRMSTLGAAGALSTLFANRAVFASTPKKGGRLRIGIADTSTTETLDPAKVLTISEIQLTMGQLRNNLVEIDHDGRAVPELAESWEPSADAATWVFKLRKGVEFHNGKTMDGEDVLYSINVHRGEDSQSGAKALLEQITDARLDGKDTITFTLSGGNAGFPYLLTTYQLQIVPAGTKGAELDKGIGTGGYILERFEPGVGALTKRNPNYWKEGTAHFDEVETIGINDTGSRTNALRSDEVDVINRCDLKTVHLLAETPGIEISETEGTLHYTVPMRTTTPPFDNNDVRLALKHAIDRELMLKQLLRGHGSLGNDHPISTANRFHAADLLQRQYDPDKAKFHLKKAGLTELKVQLHGADAAFSGAVDAGLLYRESAMKANIDIEFVREPDDGYWDNVWRQKPWLFGFWFARPTEDMMFSTGYAADAPWNETYWKHGRFNELLLEARSELDDAKRREMYGEMQRIVRDEGGTVVPLFAAYLVAHTHKLTHGPVSGSFEFDSFKLAERWWFS